MRILIVPYNLVHQPNGVAGGEIFLMRLIEHLRKEHEIRIITGHNEYYEYEGLPCYPQGSNRELWTLNNEHFQWCDVVLTHLIGTALGFNKAIQHKKPIVFIAHNNSTSYPVRNCKPEECNIIYNSYQLREDLTIFHKFNSTVLHPIIQAYPKSNGGAVTLVNCSKNKGGHILIELAELMPHIQFIGVHGGYQDQLTADHIPNLKYYENGVDMASIYAQTKILIAPSEFESYNQCCAEAMTAGIPVIANPTTGIRENLSYAGLFVDRTNIIGYVNTIKHLFQNEAAYKKQSDLSLRRSEAQRIMNADELTKLNAWLLKIK